ncbi:MAG: oxygen-independent coproporphyrinogen III oxidase [Paracoccus sp. (in: a-proteobacteria)]
MSNRSNLRRHGLFDARVPRFTSYPPATRFDAAVGAGDYAGWLEQVGSEADISLYVHVPFCRRLCWFCACRTQGTRTGAPLAGYVASVLAEAAIIRRHLPSGIRVSRLHLGGGTPTILPPALIHQLLEGLDRVLGLGRLEEFSVEIDPTECDLPRLETLAGYGLSRASIGIQDFEPRVQEAIGRAQSLRITTEVIDSLRGLGIGSINLDLLYGLPHQTLDSLSRTLDHVLAIDPDRLALYGYAHVPWMSKRQVMIPADALPSPEARLDLTERAQRRLLGAGFRQIGIDHFARPGDALAIAATERRLARSFQGYTDDRAPVLIGLGASSISHHPAGYAQNEPSTGPYQARVAAGHLPIARGTVLSEADRIVGRMVESLMCHHDIRLDELGPLTGEAKARIVQLAQDFDDCIDFDGAVLRVRPWAWPLTRIMAAALGSAGEPGQRFSAAV